MGGLRKHLAASAIICALFMVCAVLAVFSGVPVSSPVAEGVETAEAAAASSHCPDDMSPGLASLEAPRPTEDADGGTVPTPVAAVTPEAAAPPEPSQPAPEPEPEEAQVPDRPTASAVNPDRPSPTDFTAQFDTGSGDVDMSWTGVSGAWIYIVLRWSEDDFSSMLGIFQQLAVLDPSLASLVSDLDTQLSRLDQPGLTYTERNSILDDVEADVDPLMFALVRTAGAEGLMDDIVDLSDYYTVWFSTTYTDGSTSGNTYYLYGVSAWFWGGDTSPVSNCEGVYTVQNVGGSPATPTGFTATAYDPGVALEWNPNTEADLAGYNVYLRQGGNDILLNPSLITTGTEFFYDAGTVGQTYSVRAYDVFGNRSNRASAVSVLAPATYYYADDPGWTDAAGTWVLENYTSYGGYVLRVAQDPPSRTGFTFTGRRVRLYCATYCQSGDVRVWVDGVDRGTYSLYSLDPVWGVSIYTISGLKKGVPHTIELECMGTGGTTIPDSDPPTVGTFVNVQYLEVR